MGDYAVLHTVCMIFHTESYVYCTKNIKLYEGEKMTFETKLHKITTSLVCLCSNLEYHKFYDTLDDVHAKYNSYD